MKIQLKWLQELVDLQGLTLKEIIETISLYATEVEGVSKLIDATNIVVGHVLTKEKHPNSDHLSVLTVDVGEVLQIVCGAPNVEAGQTVIVALEGARLPGDFIIKRSTIRGVDSCGMVCSLQELGIEKKYIDEQYAHGIYYFEEEVPIGMKGAVALGMDGETIEIDVMPNRGDLLSMVGVAYEMSAVFNRPLKPLTLPIYPLAVDEGITLQLDSTLCFSYYGQVIRNVTLKPSPQWLKARLIAFGVRPINNVVDITNYILALYGQPLHAFDYDVLGTTITVRLAREHEELVTLDGTKRILQTSDLVITNGISPVALAGVMGGFDTEVTPNSKNILLEAAVFDPLTIRKTSTRLNLRSEASMRYERGVDLNRTQVALNHACALLVELADATIMGRPTHQGTLALPDKPIDLSLVLTRNVLGYSITMDEITSILSRLHLTYQVKGDHVIISAPNRRNDLQIPEDIIEEIGRLHGYDHVPLTLPRNGQIGFLRDHQKRRRLVKLTLSSLGLNELVTYSLVAETTLNEFNLNKTDEITPLTLLYPLSEDRKVMRQSLLPSIIDVVSYNYSRKNTNLALFELGKVYYAKEGTNYEEEWLAGVMSNQFTSTLWQQKEERVDFYVVKGILNQLFEALGVEATYLPLDRPSVELHPKRSAKIIVSGKEVGYLGQLHPQYELEHNLDEVYVFELKMDGILHQESRVLKFTPLRKLPSIERDLAFVVKKDVLASDIVNAVRKCDRQYLSDVKIFDLYQGEKIAADEKSIAIKVIFSSDEPLQEDQIQQKIQKIVKDLKYRFQANLRSV